MGSARIQVVRACCRILKSGFSPNADAAYPLGHYIEDYAYLGDLGKKIEKGFRP